jgi:hypothetical protein
MIFNFEFKFTYGNSWPELEFSTDSVKTILFENNLQQLVSYHTEINDCAVIFKNINKKESDTVVENGQIIRDQTVQLTKIYADNILLSTDLINRHMRFCPEYLPGYLTYCRENNITPEEIVHSDTLYFNGQWCLEFKQPFWAWYANCRQQEDAKYFSKSKLELYIGKLEPEHAELLEQLKELLKKHA